MPVGQGGRKGRRGEGGDAGCGGRQSLGERNTGESKDSPLLGSRAWTHGNDNNE